jgi:hypothetical protein
MREYPERYDDDGYDDDGWRRRISPDEFERLGPCEVWGEAEEGDTDDLARVLDAAEDERVVQRFLQDRPRLLAATFLRGGHGRYVRPQVRLGSQLVPDFMIADASSMGLFWTLVELESPTQAIFTASGEWAEKARHAVYQVTSWRHWLSENLDYARRPAPTGLNLIDIEPSPCALILIGRRRASAEHNWLRKELLANSRIQLHTYDELLDRVRQAERSVISRRTNGVSEGTSA